VRFAGGLILLLGLVTIARGIVPMDSHGLHLAQQELAQ
jgi:hypothetical protein